MSSKYKSGYEASIALQFQQAKVRVKYEGITLKYVLKPKGALCATCGSGAVGVMHTYRPDWVSEDELLIVESKGKFTSEMRTKMLAVIASHPNRDIRLLFMRDNWLTRKKLETYVDWAKKHGIPCAVGVMPKDWIADFKKHQTKGISPKRRTSTEGTIATKGRRKGIGG